METTETHFDQNSDQNSDPLIVKFTDNQKLMINQFQLIQTEFL